MFVLRILRFVLPAAKVTSAQAVPQEDVDKIPSSRSCLSCTHPDSCSVAKPVKFHFKSTPLLCVLFACCLFLLLGSKMERWHDLRRNIDLINVRINSSSRMAKAYTTAPACSRLGWTRAPLSPALPSFRLF